MRWALAIAGVYLLALQSPGLPRLFAGDGAPCCCKARSQACRCPICSHNRDRASGLPLVSRCPDLSPAPFVAQLDLTLPAAQQQPRPKLQQPLPQSQLPQESPEPNREVPTPPPLA